MNKDIGSKCEGLIIESNAHDIERRIYSTEYVSPAVVAGGGNKMPKIKEGNCVKYRIRKLTPKECFRLQGVKDEDFEKIRQNQSDSSLYHLAGDSITTTVLMGIFGELLNIEYADKITEVEQEISKEQRKAEWKFGKT